MADGLLESPALVLSADALDLTREDPWTELRPDDGGQTPKNSIFSGFLLCHLVLAATTVVGCACIEVNQVEQTQGYP